MGSRDDAGPSRISNVMQASTSAGPDGQGASGSGSGERKEVNGAGAVAGSEHARVFPYVPQGPSHFAPINGSDDLLTLFDLGPTYDRYVRPYLKPPEPAPSHPSLASASASPIKPEPQTSDPKGKSKAPDVVNGSEADHKDAPKRAKMEKSYGHWVSDVGGRNSIKKDHYLRDLMMNPEWQPPPSGSIRVLDGGMLRDGFTLLPGALPGFDTSHWVAEEGGPKRKKKKRKLPDGTSPIDTPSSIPSAPTTAGLPPPIGTPGLKRNSATDEDLRRNKRMRGEDGSATGTPR